MKTDPISQLEAFRADDFQDWLVDGVKRMNGIDRPMAPAFAPVDQWVGHSRERNWIADLARSVYPELSQGASHRLCAGLSGAIQKLAGEPIDSHWQPLAQLLELTRLLQPEQRCAGIGALADALERSPSELEVDERVHLISAALLALLEARGAERLQARPLALRLTELLLTVRADMSAEQKAAVGKRLRRLPGVDQQQLAQLGLVTEAPISPSAQRFSRRAPTPMPEYESSDV